jgi:8-oxo-dGTP diphosphatase
MSTPIRAAGGVVWRRDSHAVRIAVVHRARYDDWSLPKGTLKRAESPLCAAVREVREETGARVAVSRRIGTVRYDATAGPKRVTFWAMRYKEGEFAASDEVDRLDWLDVPAARSRLCYSTDRAVLDNFEALPVPDSVIVLVRHARAGRRTEWHRDDRLRPLDAAGLVQARRLADLLRCFGPVRVCAADLTRCVQTVEPLAAALGLPIEIESVFSDESYTVAPEAAVTAVLALGKPGAVSVICAQGVSIRDMLDRIGPGLHSSDTRKGAWWVLTLVDGEVVSADHYDAP